MTQIALDETLLAEARIAGGHPTDEEAAAAALREYAATRRRAASPAALVELFGTLDYDPVYDYKAARRDKARVGPYDGVA